jgi:uncharacterized membrane protein YfcA
MEDRGLDGWLGYVALFVGGSVAGVLNVLAGGGSFLTVPILIEVGLAPTVANGTNRLGVVLQSLVAAQRFRRHGVLDARWSFRAAVPALIGAVAGTLLAMVISDAAFRRVLALFMVVITVWNLWTARPVDAGRGQAPRWLLAIGFFAVGVYGGFVQAGVGFLILVLTTLAGFDLVRGNAIKVLLVGLFSTLSLLLFASSSMVAWVPGLVLAAGTVTGGLLGVRLTVLKGHAWVRAFVTVAVVILAVRLLLPA